MRTDRVPEALKEKWASIREATIELAVSRKTIHALINADTLKTKKYLGDRTLISRESIRELLEQYV
jgi:ribosomal protein L19E